MTYEISIGGEEPFPFATITGLHDVGVWVDRLPVDRFPCVVHFFEYGWEQDLDDFEAELRAALLQSPPDTPDVQATVEGLLEKLTERDPVHQSIVLTDGLGPDDGEPDVVVGDGDQGESLSDGPGPPLPGGPG